MNTDSKGNAYIDAAGIRITGVPRRTQEPDKDWSDSDVIRIQDYRDDKTNLKPGPEIPLQKINDLIDALNAMAASLQGSLSKDQGAHLLPAITAKTAKVNETSKDGLANKAAVYGILCWTCLLGFVTAIPAVIYGHKALIQAKAHPAKKGLRRAWLGILSGYAFMAFLVSCLIANLLDPTQWIDAINAKSSSKFSVGLLGPTGKVVDGVAITEKTAVYQSSPSLLGYEAAQAIYEIAKERPDVKSVKVIFYMNPSGVEDKYGKSVKAPLLMGEINELQLDEVRRYRDAEAFAYHAKMRYAALISRMDHAHLFK